jgi:nitrate reductase beta subunit
MWWNNVETKPGTGFPTRWEDQLNWKGGWELGPDRRLRLRSQSKASSMVKLFFNPSQPSLDDYYEPWTYRYQDLHDAAAGDDQPTAVPVSQITGEVMDIEAGPNWDDDLSGSPIYAKGDPNLGGLTEDERRMLFEVEGLAMMYLPRICNHCANPSCVAACPSGAMYKRGEDGVVLINQDACRGWRACVAACPYKKIYFNWQSGKSEKCILCYPRLETGQPPACFHSCVGRIRYLGVLLYDASRIETAMRAPEEALVEAQRDLLLDPTDPKVQAGALANGITPEMLDAARRSPIYRWVKEWKLALPLHPEFRTLPMLYYVPPLLPVMGRGGENLYRHGTEEVLAAVGRARLPLKYLAGLFSAGNVDVLSAAMHKLVAVRAHMRQQQVGDIDAGSVEKLLRDAGLTAADAQAIYELTALCDPSDRYVLPPLQREEAMAALDDGCGAEAAKGSCGVGLVNISRRRP